jgi:hypothetical protein
MEYRRPGVWGSAIPDCGSGAVGGEVHPRVRLVLLAEDREARVAYGTNSYDLRLE